MNTAVRSSGRFFFSLNKDKVKIFEQYCKRSATMRWRKSSPQTALGINCQEKKEKSCQDCVIRSSPNAPLHPSILHPSIPVPNSHQASRWLTVVPSRPRCPRTTLVHTHPPDAMAWLAVSGALPVFGGALTGRRRLALACECVGGLQGSEPPGSLSTQMWSLADVSGQAESTGRRRACVH